MAEALGKAAFKAAGHDVVCRSAGVMAIDGGRASANAIAAMAQMGIDIAGHISQSVTQGMVEQADAILTMCESHRREMCARYPHWAGKIYTLHTYAKTGGKDVLDPFGQDIYAYEQCAAEINDAIKRIAAGWAT